MLENFIGDIHQYLTGSPEYNKNPLIKKHSENLEVQGDISFPNTLMPWQERLSLCGTELEQTDGTFLANVGKDLVDLIHYSKNWTFTINKTKEEKGRVHLFIERPNAIRSGLSSAIENGLIIYQKVSNPKFTVHCDPLCENQNTVTDLRVKYICEVIKNLYLFSNNCVEVPSTIFITSKSTSKASMNHEVVLCGSVLNSKTGKKETVITADEFVRIRQKEMTLIAQHKYGVRVTTDVKWKQFIDHLGESAVRFELLQTRPSGAVKINFDCSSSGSSKGAAFVLYNCARLETIIRTYNDRVNIGAYPPLPDIENADFSLLTQEDEWSLVYNYILGLPLVLNNCVVIDDECRNVFRPHIICSFLCSMVRTFSQYYRRTRILTEPRQHLLPVMYARLHMLTALNKTLKSCLKILNIKSVPQM